VFSVTQNVPKSSGASFRPQRGGELTAFPRYLAGFRGGPEPPGMGKKEEGKKEKGGRDAGGNWSKGSWDRRRWSRCRSSFASDTSSAVARCGVARVT